MCMCDAGKRTLRDFRLQKRKLLYVFKAFFMVLLHLISLLRYFSSGVYFFFSEPCINNDFDQLSFVFFAI